MVKSAEQRWQIFKEAFLRTQELSIRRSSKSGEEGKSLWLNQNLLVKLKSKLELNLTKDAKKNKKGLYKSQRVSHGEGVQGSNFLIHWINA